MPQHTQSWGWEHPLKATFVMGQRSETFAAAFQPRMSVPWHKTNDREPYSMHFCNVCISAKSCCVETSQKHRMPLADGCLTLISLSFVAHPGTTQPFEVFHEFMDPVSLLQRSPLGQCSDDCTLGHLCCCAAEEEGFPCQRLDF